MSKIRVDEIVDELGTGSVSAPNGLKVSTIADVAGTGKPDFPHGFQIAGADFSAGSDLSPSNFDPTATPDIELTTSDIWTKPDSIGDDDWVTFYMVGGGGSGDGWDAGFYHTAGAGGGAHIFAALGKHLPATLTFTVAATQVGTKDAGSNGNTTSVTHNGITKTAAGGAGGNNNRSGGLGIANMPFVPDPFGVQPTEADSTGGGTSYNGGGGNSVYGGGGGGSGYSNTDVKAGGVSTYGGDGGENGNTTREPGNGVAPGGGGGSVNHGTKLGGDGAGGTVRIYYG